MDKTNWPDIAAKPKQRQASFFAVDVDGETVLTCQHGSVATEAYRHYASQGREVEIRFVQLEEKDFQQADEERKKKLWEEVIYKPTPVRRLHFR